MNIELINFLHESTEIKDGHWLWTDGLFNTGYASFWYNGSTWAVHRLSLHIYLKIPYKGDWVACHIDSICPYKHCWNPLHLYAGTMKDNTQDRIEAGTQIVINDYNRNKDKTHCPRGHKYDAVDKRQRYCKACKRIDAKNRYDKYKRS